MKRQWLIYVAGIAWMLGSVGNTLADPIVDAIVNGPQTPITIMPGDKATYTVSVGVTDSISVDVYLTLIDLPEGVTASFSRNPLRFQPNDPEPQTSTLTLRTSGSLPCGVYTFNIRATDPVSSKHKTVTTTLVVAESDPGPAPAITSICLQKRNPNVTCKGGPSRVFVIEATTDLINPSWQAIATNVTDLSGWYVFADSDSTNYPSRFYRTAPY